MKRRRVESVPIAIDPRIRDVWPLITKWCDVQTFARLKRVCRALSAWLPEHHPDVAVIREAYLSAGEFPYRLVPPLFDAYYRRFLQKFPEHARKYVLRCEEPIVKGGEIGVLLADGGITDTYGNTGSHIFETDPWSRIEIVGIYKLDGTGVTSDYVSLCSDDDSSE